MSRLDPKVRKSLLREVAIGIALTSNYQRITLKEVARIGQVSTALIINYFKTIPNLKRLVMREAVDRGIVEIVAQGLGARDSIAIRAPKEIKEKALAFLNQ